MLTSVRQQTSSRNCAYFFGLLVFHFNPESNDEAIVLIVKSNVDFVRFVVFGNGSITAN